MLSGRLRRSGDWHSPTRDLAKGLCSSISKHALLAEPVHKRLADAAKALGRKPQAVVA
jgi:hypothetical protein